MKQNNKLNKAFQDALQGQTEPLREAQWERLSAALGETKPKKRFLPWFLLCALVALSSVMIGYYIGQNSGTEIAVADPQLQQEQSSHAQSQAQLHEEKTGSSNTEGQQADHSASTNRTNEATTQIQQEAGKMPSDKTLNENKMQKQDRRTDLDHDKKDVQTALKQDAQKNMPARIASGNHEKKESPDVKPADKNEQTDTKIRNNKEDNTIAQAGEKPLTGTGNSNEQTQSETDNTSYVSLPPSPIRPFDIRMTDSLPLRVQDPYVPFVIIKKKKDPSKDIPRFAIGFSSGFSPVKTTVSAITNDRKVHKDTRSLFEQSSNGQKSMFANIGFDYLLFSKLSLGFSGGLQYREISNEVNIDYKLNQVPWYEANGDIGGYYPVSDSFAAVIKVNSHTTLKYVNIPLKLSYGLIFMKKNELQFSGGINMSILAGAQGSLPSISEASVRPIDEMVNSFFNVGYTGGLMYSRKVYKHFWLGLETQFQRNHMKFYAGEGTLKSKTDIYNFNLNLRYRF